MIHLLLTTVDDVLATGDRLLGSTGGAGAASLVSAADRAAADSRRADLDRRRTLAGRLALRFLACAVQGRSWFDAASVPVDRTCEHCSAPHGRPRIAGSSASTSTSGRLVLVAVGDDAARLGVDVEEYPETLWDGFDDYALHPAERAAMPTGRDGLVRRVQVWTDKEALLKSVGVGLRGEPSGLRVAAASAGVTTAAPLLGWRPVAQSADPRLATAWTVTINAGRRAAASIAAAHPTPIRPWRMDRQGAEPVQPDVRRDTAASVPAATA
ncbi:MULTISPECIES: 4'-phosphopantetheinyl transferase family protein [Curtobacterium]|uniref:4'-phosphopantetheinyl transferase superfamily protein n=2 Tax=Curtobacterium TaxID=2034 RepID=A0A9Q2ZSK4_9MICO|nr:4'-phosphopantetheinyl transferase superfamily protein [Curtobacterium flaccumfaciens]MBT1543384.1 4'-phosphopantetheinyl transferase superfamily protein [Curtobacterium flaccumfaciens pv. flaccumfaciens]MBT1611799.1 4'-phosphopantetheinyl transferase superfamily protein [Curtobacterium flaccumfaciens pv. poinsettiae]MCX2849646.1 4'-phosphopantetheinyl transferase superfamily protein [Curtobacterium flaccumfaciens pv. poinsettiae]UXN18202.1 4'-phosphopantetheinyl transferase superfamily prot